MQKFTVSEAARYITQRTGQTVSPQVISNLFYRRQLDDELCAIVDRIRIIPGEYLPEIERALVRGRYLVRDVEKVDQAGR